MYGYATAIAGTLGAVFYYSALPTQRVPLMVVYVAIVSAGNSLMVAKDKRAAAPGHSLIGT